MSTENTLDPNNDAAFAPVETDNSEALFDKLEREDENTFMDDFKRPEHNVPEGAVAATEEAPASEEQVNEDEDGSIDLTAEELEQSISAADQEELALINKLTNSNFKSKDEMKQALSQKETNEQAELITQNREVMNYYKAITEMTPEDAIFEDERVKAHNNNIDFSTDEWKYATNAKIDSLKESPGGLEYAVRAIKNDYASKADKLAVSVNQYDSEQSAREQQKVTDRKTGLESAVTEFYQDEDFYGMQLDKTEYVDAFKEASQNKLIDLIQNDPKVAVELQLLFRNKDKLLEIGRKPTYSNGVEDTRKQIFTGQKPRSGKVVRNNNNGAGNNLSAGDLWAK